MNLLTDPWIPARQIDRAGYCPPITFEEMLCGNKQWEVALPRDDLEMACLQLLISLTQVLFPPDNAATLRRRVKTPLTVEEYASGTNISVDEKTKVLDWFDLDHPDWPFMQTRGLKNGKLTGLQKLLLGLPEGSNHCFFNEATEVQFLGAPVASIALFHQGSNSPSFGGGPGGGFKASLRGNGPVTTLVFGSHLRETIWRNVLTREYLHDVLSGYDFDYSRDKPTWVSPIEEGKPVNAKDIGLLRGLFWQPAHVELVKADVLQPCDLLGGKPDTGYSGFLKEPFGYKVEGFWQHPHGVATFETKKDKKTKQLKREEKYLSFTTTAPAWTQMSEFVVPRGNRDNKEDKEGSQPAWPVSQFGKVWRGQLNLLVGGYRVENGAALRERRHEVFSLASGWDGSSGNLKHIIGLALRVRDVLSDKVFEVSKGNKKKGFQGLGISLDKTAEARFYRRTERLVQSALVDIPFDGLRFNAHREHFVVTLANICEEIFKELTSSYAAKPELVPIIAVARAGLGAELAKLRKEVQIHGG